MDGEGGEREEEMGLTEEVGVDVGEEAMRWYWRFSGGDGGGGEGADGEGGCGDREGAEERRQLVDWGAV